MGNTGVIGAGDVQWMTAGSGIIHQEMPKESPTGAMWGFQFWANLPAGHAAFAYVLPGEGYFDESTSRSPGTAQLS